MSRFISNKVLGTLNFGSFHGKIVFTVGYTFAEICLELKKQKCWEWLEAFKQTDYLWSSTCSGFVLCKL